MKLINSTLLAFTIIGWFLFFISVWKMTNYWATVIWLLTLIAITAGFVLTTPSSIKVMTEEEPEQLVEYIDEPVDWQECYKIAEKDELDREADRIIKEVSESRYRIDRGEADV